MDHPLIDFRKKNGLSRRAMAERVHTSRQTIHRIEKGDQTPSLALVGRIINATGGELRADDFLPPAGTPDASASEAA